MSEMFHEIINHSTNIHAYFETLSKALICMLMTSKVTTKYRLPF